MSELWESALSDLRERLSVESFETWLSPIRFDGIDGRTVQLSFPNRFCADWIRTHYLDLILESLCHQTGSEALQAKLEIDEKLADRINHKKISPSSIPPPDRIRSEEPMRQSTGLNPKYRFENFVVGPSNQLANAASIAAATNPGRKYNPLFIYGGVGLGKTHLINAVGHRVLQNRPTAKILYVSAERFTNEFIRSLQNQQINEFRDRYRNQYDIILIDDIQFLATREQTQEEFFHTFNALYHSDKQIVMSCDVYPQQIREMEERLVSRFQWGMVADIQAPELDTRVAIVKKKAEQEGIFLSDDVSAFLAEMVKSNVRELEGMLLRLAVKAELLNRSIDIEFAKETLRSALPPSESVTTVEDIQRAVCDYFGIRLIQLKSHRRHRSVTHPRMIAMYICRQRLGTSYTELGWRFGGKDHTTIINAVRKISSLVENEDQSIRSSIEAIERKLNL
jgi:chromosomal replication initiator protein